MRALLLVLLRVVPSTASLAPLVSATHWSPCYFLNPSLPCLWDGASTLYEMGTKSIKLVLSSAVNSTYPWNSDWTSQLRGVTDLASLAQTPYYDAVFRGRGAGGDAGGGWNFSTFDLITYRVAAGGEWCVSFTPDDAIIEEREFAGLTAHFLRAFSGTEKTFLLEHWEGDWAARCGSYDGTKPADPRVQARMVAWLAARQRGVDSARAAWCEARNAADSAAPALDCSNGRAIHAAAGVTVLHASEVNLVLSSMESGFPNNILEVVPKVALDALSYSSYDTQWLNPQFADALDFIASHHNRTTASPPAAVWVAEYGLALNDDPYPSDALALYQHVIATALTPSPVTGAPRAFATFAWELFDNEHAKSVRFPGERCTAATGPEFDASQLRGFWLRAPNGSASPGWTYLASLATGASSPPPPPSPPSTPCTYEPDTDMQGTAGDSATALTAAACCATCRGDLRCAAATYANGLCERKFGGGGVRVPKQGATLCVARGGVAVAAADKRV